MTQVEAWMPEDKQLNIIIHCTITGMGGTWVEPNVPPSENAIEGFRKIAGLIGAERTVLRVDPIIPHEHEYGPDLSTALNVLNVTSDDEVRVRISFIDKYYHIMYRNSNFYSSLNWNGVHAPLEMRQEALNKIKKIRPDVEICGEPDFACTGCVSIKDIETFGILYPDKMSVGKQRPECSCLAFKHELLSKKGQCFHGCIYCYWRNT